MAQSIQAKEAARHTLYTAQHVLHQQSLQYEQSRQQQQHQQQQALQQQQAQHQVELQALAQQTSGVAAYWKNQYQARKKGLW